MEEYNPKAVEINSWKMLSRLSVRLLTLEHNKENTNSIAKKINITFTSNETINTINQLKKYLQ